MRSGGGGGWRRTTAHVLEKDWACTGDRTATAKTTADRLPYLNQRLHIGRGGGVPNVMTLIFEGTGLPTSA